MIFECVGAQNDQFVQKALDRENVFELFMRIMNDPQWLVRCLPFSCMMYELSRGSRPRLAAPVVQTATAMIDDTAAERGLDFSAELITSASRRDVARGIPRYDITPRASGNNNRLSSLWRAAISPAGVARSLSKVSSYRNFRRAIVSRGENCRD